MLCRCWYYVSFVWHDLVRQPKATQIQAVVVAGICLPVLILVMLKRGHVQELRRELVESPTGRLVRLYCSGGGDFFPRDELHSFCRRLGPIDVVIPENVVRGCTVCVEKSDGSIQLIEGVDINATSPGDPMLSQDGCDVLANDEDGILISSSLARESGIGVGEQVQVNVVRFAANEQARIKLRVKAIVPADSSRPSAIMNSVTLDRIKGWQRGQGIERWQWPALVDTTSPRYRQFLLFTEADDPLTERGRRELARRQLQVEPLPTKEHELLKRLLRPEFRDGISVYRISDPRVDGDLTTLSVDPATLADRTPADDVIIPRSSPVSLLIDGHQTLAVGLSVPELCWLRFRFHQHQVVFRDEDDPLQISGTGLNHSDSDPVLATTASGLPLLLSVVKSSTGSNEDAVAPPSVSDGPAIVPVQLLAQLESLSRGQVRFDEKHLAFLPVPKPVSYEEVRLFASSIDDVPAIVDRAVAAGYGFQANSRRIKEIQHQSASLQVLVNVVGIAVFTFGMITVTVVLIESTHQKCGTIGILRVMGASQRGLFAFVCLRAAAIGCLGGLGATVCAAAFAMVMGASPQAWTWLPASVVEWKPDVRVVIVNSDFFLTVAISTACCVAGAFLPALRAIRIDPVEAVIEGRLR